VNVGQSNSKGGKCCASDCNICLLEFKISALEETSQVLLPRGKSKCFQLQSFDKYESLRALAFSKFVFVAEGLSKGLCFSSVS
jgi:hypothetical protein